MHQNLLHIPGPFPYKSTRKQNWLCHKHVKVDPSGHYRKMFGQESSKLYMKSHVIAFPIFDLAIKIGHGQPKVFLWTILVGFKVIRLSIGSGGEDFQFFFIYEHGGHVAWTIWRSFRSHSPWRASVTFYPVAFEEIFEFVILWESSGSKVIEWPWPLVLTDLDLLHLAYHSVDSRCIIHLFPSDSGFFFGAWLLRLLNSFTTKEQTTKYPSAI